VITIGNFDGVHLGHRAIIAATVSLAAELGAVSRAITFDPHPVAVLRPGQEPPRLSSIDERVSLLRAARVDDVIVLQPTPPLLALEPDAFISQIVAQHQPAAFVEGPDFRFGKRRAGDVNVLAALGRELGFATHVVPDVEAAMSDHLLAPVSSSLIRWLIGCGRVRDAGICLGRPFALRAMVVQGDQRGRRWSIPTANLDMESLAGRALPGDGVFAGAAVLPDGSRRAAAISVGIKPTFRGQARVIEAHLLDFDGDLYGQVITIEFHRFVRDQQTFPDIEVLRAQLERDIAATRRLREMDVLP
jgi:riboflavin kinase/FMN adenylyltransferase